MRDHGLAAGLADHQIHPRRGFTQASCQGRQNHARAVIRHGQAKTAPCLRRHKGCRRQQFTQLAQGLLQRLDQLPGPCGEFQVPTAAHQQGVVEQAAQLRQGMTDGRLTAVQAQCRARHMPLGEQGMQGQQQVQVDTAQIIHMTNNPCTNLEFSLLKWMTED
ncbi:hypothetical protein D3C85_893880 [compost metagenome]